MTTTAPGPLAATVWQAIGGAEGGLGAVTVHGPEHLLPSVYDVTGLATATVAAATAAAAGFLAARTGEAPRPVTVDRRAASLAFASEGLFTPLGWERPAIWDPIAGNYRTADGWIRAHTNYAHHRAAVERVLGATDRESVAAAIAKWSGDDLESAIVAAGGCAAVMHDRTTWLASPAGRATRDEPLVHRTTRPAPVPDLPQPAATTGIRPFSGIRVLDLTRVIAGPVCTRFLAAYGADVLRIDPPGFAEVPALLPETTTGKRRAFLDLRDPGGRQAFERLVAGAHVLVTGLRADALARLGYGPDALRDLNPSLITGTLNAYGWSGPWRDRRGFDSLVQMSSGTAAAGTGAASREAGASAGVQGEPVPLPVQALDHGTGYLLVAALGRALTRLVEEGVATDVRCSLIATANALTAHPTPAGIERRRPIPVESDTEPTTTAWGPARRVPLPGAIAGIRNDWSIDAGPLGTDAPTWQPS
jgi:hypothetical protein